MWPFTRKPKLPPGLHWPVKTDPRASGPEFDAICAKVRLGEAEREAQRSAKKRRAGKS